MADQLRAGLGGIGDSTVLQQQLLHVGSWMLLKGTVLGYKAQVGAPIYVRVQKSSVLLILTTTTSYQLGRI